MAQFDINILGCGSALPTTRHSATSQIIDLRDKLYMIDCGEATQVQMRRMKMKFSRLNHIFISHLHGDHCFGLPGLISTLGMLGRTAELFIHAPSQMQQYLDSTLQIFCEKLPFKVTLNTIDTMAHQLIYEDRSLKVYSIPLSHRVPCSGFLFEEKQTSNHIIKDMTDFHQIPLAKLKDIKAGADYITPQGDIIPNQRLVRAAASPCKYAYCSDTLPLRSIIPIIDGVDLLYHEATFATSEAKRAKQTHHSTARQAAEIAQAARVKQLIIGHYSARYDDEAILLKEAQEIYPKTLLAKEGMRISLK